MNNNMFCLSKRLASNTLEQTVAVCTRQNIGGGDRLWDYTTHLPMHDASFLQYFAVNRQT